VNAASDFTSGNGLVSSLRGKPAQRSIPDVSSVRFVIPYEGTHRTLGRIAVDRRDASIYVAPFGSDGERCKGWVGKSRTDGTPTTIDFTKGSSYGRKPKVSLHESGVAHATAHGKPRYEASGPPLWNAKGGHVATLHSFGPGSMPTLHGDPKGPPHVDAELNVDPAWSSVRIAIYAFGNEEAAQRHGTYWTLVRPQLPGPLYVAVSLYGDATTTSEPGALVIAGWGHVDTTRSPLPIVYAVTK
jgi:hypothetical protein